MFPCNQILNRRLSDLKIPKVLFEYKAASQKIELTVTNESESYR